MSAATRAAFEAGMEVERTERGLSPDEARLLIDSAQRSTYDIGATLYFKLKRIPGGS